MNHSTLNQAAKNILEHYQQLSIGGQTVRCPYYNNKRTKSRAALRVLVGKGSPSEIEEEALLIALRKKINLAELSEEELTAFFVDNKLGVDCSAFAFYMLNAEKNGKLRKKIYIPSKNPIRKIISSLRTVENVNVKTLVHPKNSVAVDLAQIQAGDMITMIGTGENHNLDHVLIIEQVGYKNGGAKTISYVHSLWWKADGKYDHGIKHGIIEITDNKKPLIEQQWTEAGFSKSPKNETLWRAETAKELEIRRLVV